MGLPGSAAYQPFFTIIRNFNSEIPDRCQRRGYIFAFEHARDPGFALGHGAQDQRPVRAAFITRYDRFA